MKTTFADKETRTDDLDATLDTLLGELTDAVDEASASETLKNWLDTYAQFHDYSFNNTLLAQLQLAARDGYSGVTHLAGYNKWADMGRNVKKGESALWILAPSGFVTICNDCDEFANDCACDNPQNTHRFPTSFRDVPVFDLAQTEGDELPELGAWDITGDAGALPDALIDVITDDDITVRLTPESSWTRGSSKGVCKHDKNEIEVLQATDAQLARTLIHEYAHALTHSDDHAASERARREVEADSTAYVVGTYYGLDMTGSSLYVARWQADDSGVLKERLGRIGKDAKAIIEATDAVLNAYNEADERVPVAA
jgi:hypothetical protein